jgi:indole-3-glycerol phosphate synthase
MPSILAGIVARTREDLEERRRNVSIRELESAITVTERDFAGALARAGEARPGARRSRLGLIAEFKPRSPSRGPIRPGAKPEDIIPIYDRYADAISVLCDGPHFGGGYPLLAAARALTDRPILAKDFVVDVYQIAEARRAGADAVLLMMSVLADEDARHLLAYARALGMEPLVETHDARELERALALDARVIGVNSRDLRTLSIDTDAMVRLLEQVPVELVRVAESGVEQPSDTARLVGLADAALVGSTLMAAPDIEAKLEELGWNA